MRAQVTKVALQNTKDGPGYLVCFRGEDGKSYRAWIMTRFGNFRRWQGFMREGVMLDNLIVKDSMVNADSWPREIKLPNPAA